MPELASPRRSFRSGSFRALLQQQATYLSIAALCSAIFWAIGMRVNPATILVYSLAIGNLTTPLVNYTRHLFDKHPTSSAGLLLLATWFAAIPLIYIVSTAVVFAFAPPAPQSLDHLLTTGWKFPILVIVCYGGISLAYAEARERLERRNQELQLSVNQTAARMELQQQELGRALEIQQSLLPRHIPQLPGFDIAASWQPARTLGGDYYDVIELGSNRVGICIADVVGKGTAAALLMANVQAVVRAFARDAAGPASVCSSVNSVLCGNIGTGKFVTFFYGVLDAGARTLQYCNAGHSPPIQVCGSSHRQLRADGAVLGIFPDWPYQDAVIELAPGDKLILFTDGLSEAEGPDGHEFGEEGLAIVAQASPTLSASALNLELVEHVSAFCHGHFADDVTLIVIAAQ